MSHAEPPSAVAGRRSRGWIDALLLAVGLLLSAFCIRQVLATGRIHWRMDLDLAATISLQLAALGPTLLGTPRLAWRRRPRTWTSGEWLWPGALVTSLAWLVVWLEDGRRLGVAAKLIAGPIALLITPVLALAALAVLAWSLRSRSRYGWAHWLGALWALTGGVGFILFLRLMLPLRF